MINKTTAAPAWRGFDLSSVDRLSGVDRAFLLRYVAGDDPSLAAAAAFLIAAKTKPDQCAKPLTWLRRSSDAFGLMVSDAEGKLWTGELVRHVVGGGAGCAQPKVTWLFEVTSGPFDPDSDPRPTRMVDPRKAKRPVLEAFFGSVRFAEAA